MEKYYLYFVILTTISIIANYTVIYPIPRKWLTSGRAFSRQNAAPMLLINTPGKGALWGAKLMIYIIFLAILKVESSLIFDCLIFPIFSYIVVKIIPTYLNPVNDTKLVFYCIVL